MYSAGQEFREATVGWLVIASGCLGSIFLFLLISCSEIFIRIFILSGSFFFPFLCAKDILLSIFEAAFH